MMSNLMLNRELYRGMGWAAFKFNFTYFPSLPQPPSYMAFVFMHPKILSIGYFGGVIKGDPSSLFSSVEKLVESNPLEVLLTGI